jgi:hypothetical protein
MEWSYQGNEIRKDNKKRKMGRHISPEYMTNEKKDLNLYLFFDLLQLSRDIINIPKVYSYSSENRHRTYYLFWLIIV